MRSRRTQQRTAVAPLHRAPRVSSRPSFRSTRVVLSPRARGASRPASAIPAPAWTAFAAERLATRCARAAMLRGRKASAASRPMTPPAASAVRKPPNAGPTARAPPAPTAQPPACAAPSRNARRRTSSPAHRANRPRVNAMASANASCPARQGWESHAPGTPNAARATAWSAAAGAPSVAMRAARACAEPAAPRGDAIRLRETMHVARASIARATTCAGTTWMT